MLSPISLTPNMDMATLVNALNNNFQQVASENRTKVITANDGTNRILIGYDTNSDDYLVAISVKSVDVLNALQGTTT